MVRGEQGFDDDASLEALAKLRPLNAYGWSKHLFDRWVARELVEGAPRPPQWAGLKFFNVYGPNEYHKGGMQSVVAQKYPLAAAGKGLTLFRSHRPDVPDGGQKRDFVYVGDCANVVTWLLEHPEVNACSTSVPVTREPSRISRGPCSRRSISLSKWSTCPCRKSSGPTTSTSPRRAWSGCARPVTRAPSLRSWTACGNMLRTTCRSLTASAERAAAHDFTMKYRHVILDRDGVLNQEAPDSGYVREPAQFHWLPGALEALAILRGAGVHLTVATNQSGVGRGLMSLAQLTAVHERMLTEAAGSDAALDAVLFLSARTRRALRVRKPAPGLIHEAIRRSGIAAADSLVVGDAERDLEAAARAGVTAALVRTGKGRATEAGGGGKDVRIYDDLSQLARELVGNANLKLG